MITKFASQTSPVMFPRISTLNRVDYGCAVEIHRSQIRGLNIWAAITVLFLSIILGAVFA